MSATPGAVIEMQRLTREFTVRTKSGRLRRAKRVVRAVDGITATVAAGETCAYIGVNGAGKSTTIKMITGILVPTSGSVRTCGMTPVPQRRHLARRIGVVFGQRSQLWWDLPVGDSFTILAALHELPEATARDRVARLVDELDIRSYVDTPVRQLSLGQRMRAEVAAALVHQPELLVLDEPTLGLDMISKQQVRDFLARECAEQGTTLLLTTHDMADVEQLCRRVLVVDDGRLAYDGSLDGLNVAVALPRTLVVDLYQRRPAMELTSARTVAVEMNGRRHRLQFSPRETTAAEVLGELSRMAEVRDLTVDEPAIEEVVRALHDPTAATPDT